jgi:hypothetical protein
MVNRALSRRELLIGAGAASIAGLAAGCSSGTPTLLPGNAGAASRISPFRIASQTVDVSTPTGEAIQNAIDSLASTGGEVLLTASQPYIVDKTITIPYNNINLVGRGLVATVLKAKPGAVLTGGSLPDEYLLLIEGATAIGVERLAVDLIDQANSSGHSRNGIGVFGADGVSITGVSVIKNLGPSAKNTGILFDRSANVKATNCSVSASRTGLSVQSCKSFQITNLLVQKCSALAPHYTGPTSGLAILSSTGGKVMQVQTQENKVSAGILVRNSAGLQVEHCEVDTTLAFPTHANDGIVLEQSSGAAIVLSRCSVLRNSGNGITVRNISNLSISQCSVAQNNAAGHGGAGINLKGGTSNVKILNNSVTRGHRNAAGITAGNAAAADVNGKIENNTVHGFGVGVALGDDSSHFVVEDNDLSKNATCYTNAGSGNAISGNQC